MIFSFNGFGIMRMKKDQLSFINFIYKNNFITIYNPQKSKASHKFSCTNLNSLFYLMRKFQNNLSIYISIIVHALYYFFVY